jgi:hypothetical protein
MKKIIPILLLITIVTACENGKEEIKYQMEPCIVCDSTELANARSFVSDNVKNANNMSDEEMEDVIEELTTSGLKLSCRRLPLKCYQEDDGDYIAVDVPKGTMYYKQSY